MRGGAKCGHGFTTKMRRCTAMNVLKTERKTLSLQAAVRLKQHPWFDIVELKITKTQPSQNNRGPICQQQSTTAFLTKTRPSKKCLKLLADENIPLSKYESLINLLKELEISGLDCLIVGKRIYYESYYSAKALLRSISDVIDDGMNSNLSLSPCFCIC